MGLTSGLNQCAGSGAELGFIVTGADFEFLKRIEIGIDNGNPEDGALIFGTVEEKAIGGEELPIYVCLDTLLRIFTGRVLPGN